MQDFIPLSVLSSEAFRDDAMPDAMPNAAPNAMPDATTIPDIPSPSTAAPFASRDGAYMPISSESTDEQLILALREGSEEAFATLFHRYKQPIFGFFSRRLVDSARAEELTQETFIALLRAAKRYQPSALFRSYLYAIAFRILRSERRKSQFRAMFFGPPKAANVATVSSHTEDSLWVRRALAKLDATDREIVMLREYQQLTYAEIAALLEIPLNTVRSRLFRAREALRDLLVPPNTPPEPQTCSAGRSILSPAAFSAPQTGDESTRAKKGERQ
jgi:RNA polymerase sigma-70 factor, ECF subfamily